MRWRAVFLTAWVPAGPWPLCFIVSHSRSAVWCAPPLLCAGRSARKRHDDQSTTAGHGGRRNRVASNEACRHARGCTGLRVPVNAIARGIMDSPGAALGCVPPPIPLAPVWCARAVRMPFEDARPPGDATVSRGNVPATGDGRVSD